MTEYKHNKRLTHFSRSNRQNLTFGEQKLWSYLRNRRFLNYKFRRQFPFLNYILDFFCDELNLCIEVDGSSHEGGKLDKDKVRDLVLKRAGIITLRFTECEATRRTEDVLQSIENYVNDLTPALS